MSVNDLQADATRGDDSSSLAGEGLLLQVRNVVQEFVVNMPGRGSQRIHAVSGVSFDLKHGETLALVGESGCGKSSLARSILQLPRPQSGEVVFHGVDLVKQRGAALRDSIQGVQVVFQDPFDSLDPRWTVDRLVAEPLEINGIGTSQERRKRVDDLLEAVGLDVAVHSRRRARELSGGQCQRVAIARALALSPTLMVCDEAVSSLDVSVQAQILNLFEDLRTMFGLSYLFITHDLGVARRVSDRVAVMYLGKLVELAPADELFDHPLHPYSSALLASMPSSTGQKTVDRVRLTGELPSAIDPPSGCRFRTRCPLAQPICADIEPPLAEIEAGRMVACHFPLQIRGSKPVIVDT